MLEEGKGVTAADASHAADAWQHWLPILLAGAALLALVYLLAGLAGRNRPSRRPPWSIGQKTVYLGTGLTVALLSVTSFGSLARSGELMGWALLAHMMGAGLFVVAWPLLAITWCAPHAAAERDAEGNEAATVPFYWLPRVSFWICLIAGWLVAMTMLVSMLPLLGTGGQRQLLDLHRASGWVVAVTAIWHLAGVILQARGKR